MSRNSLALLSAIALLGACGPKGAVDEGAEAPAAVSADSIPHTARVLTIQTGKVKVADSAKAETMPMEDQFAPTDTIRVAVGTQYAGMGGKVTIQLLQGTKEIATADAVLPEPDKDGRASVMLAMAPAKPWAAGEYQVKATLDGKPQFGIILHVVAPK